MLVNALTWWVDKEEDQAGECGVERVENISAIGCHDIHTYYCDPVNGPFQSDIYVGYFVNK